MADYVKLNHLRKFVAGYSNEAALFKHFRHFGGFSQKEMRFLRDVYALAQEEYKNIVHPSGEPYIVHVQSAWVIGAIYGDVLNNVNLLAAALLQNLVEKFPRQWPYAILESRTTEKVAELIDTCTNRIDYFPNKEEYRRAYFACIKRSREAALIKLCAWMHDQMTLAACGVEQQQENNLEAKKYILPLATQYRFLPEELAESIHETDARLRERM